MGAGRQTSKFSVSLIQPIKSRLILAICSSTFLISTLYLRAELQDAQTLFYQDIR